MQHSSSFYNADTHTVHFPNVFVLVKSLLAHCAQHGGGSFPSNVRSTILGWIKSKHVTEALVGLSVSVNEHALARV